ncbi:MAG: hypothetical protein L0G87_08120 [Renibacterium salmoninarum]|nr:hypothetical protein [Renibacterium salmoninarum]
MAGDLHLLARQRVDGDEIVVSVADDGYSLCLELTIESMLQLNFGLEQLLGDLG